MNGMTIAAAIAAFVFVAATASASTASHEPAGGVLMAHHVAAATTPAMTDGEVRKVDKDAAKITLKHGPILNLDMPAMTMVFQVKDAAMIDQIKSGDRVRFHAEKVNGAYTVMEMQVVK